MNDPENERSEMTILARENPALVGEAMAGSASELGLPDFPSFMKSKTDAVEAPKRPDRAIYGGPIKLRQRAVDDYPGNDKIPEGTTESYLYAGEAGRRQNYVRSLLQRNGQYRRQVVETFGAYEPEPADEIVTNDGMLEAISEDAEGIFTISVELLGRFPKMRRIPGVRVELPHVHFGRESHHSVHNDFSGFNFPAPSLIQRLGLKSKNREIDFRDPTGNPATLYREAGSGWGGNQHKLLYVRADLLRRYLQDTRQVLVWCNWGERDWMKKMEGLDAIRDPARQKIYEAHDHIHRSFCQWSAKDSKVK